MASSCLGDNIWDPEEHLVDGDVQAEAAGVALLQVHVGLSNLPAQAHHRQYRVVDQSWNKQFFSIVCLHVCIIEAYDKPGKGWLEYLRLLVAHLFNVSAIFLP